MGKEKMVVSSCVLTIIVSILMICPGQGAVGQEPKLFVLENDACRIKFDADTGGLRSIINHSTHDPCLKGGTAGTMPFRVYADLKKEFEIGLNEKFQLVFEDPGAITKKMLTPENSNEHGEYTLTFPCLSPQVADAVFCDIETLSWAPLDLERDGDDLRLTLETNWCLSSSVNQKGHRLSASPPCQRVSEAHPPH